MLGYTAILLVGICALIGAAPQRHRQQQQQSYGQATTPVPILRQINTHNDDGSYTYGYESADGSYKIENKGSNGEVKGKYGYYDDQGQLREIEYGADKQGFVPTGSGINVPPPAPVSNNLAYNNGQPDGEDGQYNPSIHETPYDYQPEAQRQQFQQNFNFAPQQQQQQQPIFARQPSRARTYRPNNQQNYYQQAAAASQYQQPAFTNYNSAQGPNVFQGHPSVSNINPSSGSFSLNY